ncbi:MAG: T9SS type A sorting domain-containing protein [Candidatus Cloacimonetes bacterium]|nr:T9SS type A sorting domain-containing protein [Candidatus Cloacimonadota bacterium]
MLKITLISFLFVIISLNLWAEEFPIATGTYSQTYPQIVFDEENYYVVFVDKRGGASSYGFYGKFVTPEGDVLAGETEVVPAHNAMSFMHHLAWGDDQYLFVWSRQRGPYNYTRDTYARRLNESGQPLGASFPVSIGNTLSASFIRTAYDGENYLVIWQEGMPTQEAHIRAQFVSSTGTLIGQNFSIRPPDLPANTAQIYPDIVFDGTKYFVDWDDSRTGSRCIYAQFVSPAGDMVGDNIIITTEVANQFLVQTAFNGTHFLVVWADSRDNPNNKSIYGQLVDTSGNLVGDHIPISIVVGNMERSWPDIGSNGSQFLVTWQQDFYRSSSRSFENREREEIHIAAGVDVSDRQQLWYDVYGRVINANGSFATDEIPICTAIYHQDEPAVASDMQDFLVAWEDSRNQNQYYDIYGMIIEGEIVAEYHPPHNLTADIININEIYLTWEEPLPSTMQVIGYNIYENDLLLTEIEDLALLYYQTTGRDNGVYQYHVTAIYEDEIESDPSNLIEIEIVLLPPLNLEAEVDTSYYIINLWWLPPTTLRELTAYRLYRNGELLIETVELFFVDTEPPLGMNDYYVIALYDDLYESEPSNVVSAGYTNITDTVNTPLVTSLNQNIPNPFNPETIIKFTVSEPTHVKLIIYNLKGQKLKTLLDEFIAAGEYQYFWNGLDEQRREMPSGIYLYQLITEKEIITRKMIMLK